MTQLLRVPAVSIAAAVLLAPLSAAGADEPIRLTFVPVGGFAKSGHYYMPQQAKFSDAKPDGITNAPKDLSSPRYGSLAIGEKGVFFILDEPEGGTAKLLVDTNRNGDLTDDPAAEWASRTTKQNGVDSTMWNGSAQFEFASASSAAKPVLATILLYRFDPKDPARAAMKDSLFYYRDYAYEGEVPLGGKKVQALLLDERASGSFKPKAPIGADANTGVNLLLDTNGNGKFDRKGESFDVSRPFNVGGTTWEIVDLAADGSSFRIVKSSKVVAATPTPPDLQAGAVFPAFKAKDTNGEAIDFPTDYRGKLVLIDFWATWCRPCMTEMPNVVRAYEKFHAQGFEVLGISLDNSNTLKRMPEVMKEAKMTWRQIADGKGWDAELAKKFGVDGIPATFLVDGSTGKIVAANLRGDALDKAVEKALAARSDAKSTR
ncbi:MAG: TlpA family protein disulfide reductase [Phycisphaerae bacterium]|nr:TlpA family protein disulfide reductase [Phycisphaerae bacterium]